MDEAVATEKVMALVIELDSKIPKQPWPLRERVVEITGVPPSMLDWVLTRLQNDGQIVVWTTTTKTHPPGGKDDGLVQRFIQPTVRGNQE